MSTAPRVALHAGQLLQPVPGGIGRYVGALLANLPAVGVDVLAFAAGPRPPGLDAAVVWHDLGRPRGALRAEWWHRHRGGRLAVDADVVHAPSLAVPPRGSRPLVVTVHDVAFLRVPGTFTRRGTSFHRRGLALTRAEADVVVVPSPFTRGELVAEGFDPDRIVVAPHGADPPPDIDDAVVDRLVAAAGVASPFVLSVGTVEPRKGLATLAAAHAAVRARHPALELVIAGAPGWGAIGGLDGPGVRRLGRVSDALLDALYRTAALCVQPSQYEGFGLPALEAMARGRPVVTTTGSAPADVVGDAGVLVAPDDADALAGAILELLADPARCAALGDAALARARQFSWPASAAAHAAAYRRALGRS